MSLKHSGEGLKRDVSHRAAVTPTDVTGWQNPSEPSAARAPGSSRPARSPPAPQNRTKVPIYKPREPPRSAPAVEGRPRRGPARGQWGREGAAPARGHRWPRTAGGHKGRGQLRARAGPAERGPARGSSAQGWPRPPQGTLPFFPQERAISDGWTEPALRAAHTALLWSCLRGDQSTSCLSLRVLRVSHLDTSCLPLSPNLPRCCLVLLFVRKVTIIHKYTDQKAYSSTCRRGTSQLLGQQQCNKNRQN